MNYDKYKEVLRTALIRAVLVLFISLFNISIALSLSRESIAVSELEAGDSIYVITNREIDTTHKELAFTYKVDETARLKFLKVTLNDSLEIINQQLSSEDFMLEVCTKTFDWLLYVHGDGKTYNESVQRGFDIQNTYNVNLIVFSWPSELPNINGLKNFKNSERNVTKSVGHFNQLISFMKDFKENNMSFQEEASLSMLLHSLGNLYLKELLNATDSEQINDTIFENIIMNSAAVNREHHQKWVERVSFQKRIYITNNHYDYSLKGLHIYTKHGNQLGEEFNGAMAKNANYVHFTEAVGFRTPTSNTHTYFIGEIPRESQNIRSFYNTIFQGNQIDFSDPTQFVKREEELGYDIVF